MITYIYGLRCPVSDRVMYVGKAVKAQTRLFCHVREAINGGQSAKSLWIRGLLDTGYQPTLEILEVCHGDNWRERETFWIKHHRALNPALTNVHPGGNGGRQLLEHRLKKVHVFSVKLDKNLVDSLCEMYGIKQSKLFSSLLAYVWQTRPTLEHAPITQRASHAAVFSAGT
jgi:hypothetical protein